MFGYYSYLLNDFSTLIFIIPAMLLAMFAQFKVNRTYSTYKKIANESGISGYETARRILDANGLQDISIYQVEGKLSDNYNPLKKTLNLSKDVYQGRSISSISIAAHECGHAIQHAQGYAPVKIRTAIFPVVQVSSYLSWILIIAGFIFSMSNLVLIGIIAFSAVVLFQLVTLPVEFNASTRALEQLRIAGIAHDSELYGAKKVLSAAAFTYIAATLVAIMQLLRLVMLFGRRR